MYHSMWIGVGDFKNIFDPNLKDKHEGWINTYEDWHIVPSSRPTFVMPKQKTQIIDLPGSNGALDISESLTGYPIYSNREGTFEFLVLNDYNDWTVIYSKIANYLSGRTFKIVLEDDPNYFYEGKIFLESFESTVPWSSVKLSYNVNPYKWSITESVDSDWLWDTFNFETGKILAPIYKDITIDSLTEFVSIPRMSSGDFSSAPVTPDFKVSEFTDTDNEYLIAKYTVRTDPTDPQSDVLYQQTAYLSKGSNLIPRFTFFNTNGTLNAELSIKGAGKLDLVFRNGVL